uniref:Uncharacterized protein n=1 Tax=Chromera velia CCMP2878 TaxID=1169474 RepID=A0A0G4HNB7_9ALVE|eukprot:Cvel_1193.t1-p1 / transcript=Cvel_1193.t1 / gene=Cvel_1193 / organism=Chromera_velia_CCMP2878 / gene_product=hypothetical protein / transcript_product=hypothetical protein / location=Cvel_scaffold39:146554-147297(-) / protein_length=248 / sequence_SO=supercontig / SO=protein_coding / is_pseudo=false
MRKTWMKQVTLSVFDAREIRKALRSRWKREKERVHNYLVYEEERQKGLWAETRQEMEDRQYEFGLPFDIDRIRRQVSKAIQRRNKKNPPTQAPTDSARRENNDTEEAELNSDSGFALSLVSSSSDSEDSGEEARQALSKDITNLRLLEKLKGTGTKAQMSKTLLVSELKGMLEKLAPESSDSEDKETTERNRPTSPSRSRTEVRGKKGEISLSIPPAETGHQTTSRPESEAEDNSSGMSAQQHARSPR